MQRPRALRPFARHRTNNSTQRQCGLARLTRARAEWHFGSGPDYCRGCAALDRDCGLACPYAAHAPASIEGAAAWAAGTTCATVTMAALDLDMPAALATAREMGAFGSVAAELLLAMRMGLAAGSASRRADPTGH